MIRLAPNSFSLFYNQGKVEKPKWIYTVYSSQRETACESPNLNPFIILSLRRTVFGFNWEIAN